MARYSGHTHMTDHTISTSPVSSAADLDAASTAVAVPVPSSPPRLGLTREVQDGARGHLPLTVWLAAADTESIATCAAGCCHPVSGPLARHLVTACARLGETVVHLGASDHQVVSAALTAGCLPVAVYADAARAGVTWTRLARTHPDSDLEVTDLRITDLHDEMSVLADLAGCAGLVVAEQPCQQPAGGSTGRPGSETEAEAFDIASAAGLVKPGGHLVVVTGLHRQGGVVDPLPEIIARAREAGLVYLQHIIALRQPVRGERIDPDLSRRALAALQELPECAGLPASARAHSDVLLFARPRSAGPDGSTPAVAKLAGEPGDTESTTQAGGGR